MKFRFHEIPQKTFNDSYHIIVISCPWCLIDLIDYILHSSIKVLYAFHSHIYLYKHHICNIRYMLIIAIVCMCFLSFQDFNCSRYLDTSWDSPLPKSRIFRWKTEIPYKRKIIILVVTMTSGWEKKRIPNDTVIWKVDGTVPTNCFVFQDPFLTYLLLSVPSIVATEQLVQPSSIQP